MAIQMMKGYGMPSARTVDFSGVSGFGDFAMGEFLGGHSPEQFMKIPPLDGYGYADYNADVEDEAQAALACQAAGGKWDGVNGVCQMRGAIPASDPRLKCAAGGGTWVEGIGCGATAPAPQPPASGNTLGKVLGWGAALYFAARWLK